MKKIIVSLAVALLAVFGSVGQTEAAWHWITSTDKFNFYANDEGASKIDRNSFSGYVWIKPAQYVLDDMIANGMDSRVTGFVCMATFTFSNMTVVCDRFVAFDKYGKVVPDASLKDFIIPSSFKEQPWRGISSAIWVYSDIYGNGSPVN